MHGMNAECVDLIYLDPPFNSNRTYEAPIGSKAAGAAFKDAWTLDDVDVHEHGELADRNPAAYAVIEADSEKRSAWAPPGVPHHDGRPDLLECGRAAQINRLDLLHCGPDSQPLTRSSPWTASGRANAPNAIVSAFDSGAHGRAKRWRSRYPDTLMFSQLGECHIWQP